jgi:hypothetical protein
VDAKSSCDTLSKDSGLPQDKRLAIDLAALRELLARPLNEVRWIPGPLNPADILTKHQRGNSKLQLLMQTGQFSLKETAELALKRSIEATKRRDRKHRGVASFWIGDDPILFADADGEGSAFLDLLLADLIEQCASDKGLDLEHSNQVSGLEPYC